MLDGENFRFEHEHQFLRVLLHEILLIKTINCKSNGNPIIRIIQQLSVLVNFLQSLVSRSRENIAIVGESKEN